MSVYFPQIPCLRRQWRNSRWQLNNAESRLGPWFSWGQYQLIRSTSWGKTNFLTCTQSLLKSYSYCREICEVVKMTRVYPLCPHSSTKSRRCLKWQSRIGFNLKILFSPSMHTLIDHGKRLHFILPLLGLLACSY